MKLCLYRTFVGSKAAEREANQSPVADAYNAWSFTPTPTIYLHSVALGHRGNVTITTDTYTQDCMLKLGTVRKIVPVALTKQA